MVWLRCGLLILAWLAVSSSSGLSAADWPTFRGNAARTGSVDDKPGPRQPKILWSYKTTGNFVGSPAATDKFVFVAALGAFNSGTFSALHTGEAPQRLAWTKTPPTLKLPSVASPAIANGLVHFGDGMHQNSGATLYAASAPTGTLLWKYTVPGELVHMEGGPSFAEGRVYVGAGNAGVICVDGERLTLDGKEMPAEAIRAQVEAQWKRLLDAYEKEKKIDPDFAIPPSEDSLPKVAPTLVWQRGQGAWHVDAPVAVSGNRVLVASAFLDHEKTGLRAMICLDRASGEEQWNTPLDQNPWAGATIAGELAIFGSSNIRYEPKDIPKARGTLTALNLADGTKKWSKKLPGGVVSSVAVKGSLVVSCCTDGNVRAHDLASGEEKWTYAAGGPLFAGPAIAGDFVYAGDLAGKVHAIALADGKGLWNLDLNTAAELKSARIYGAPIVHGGKIYVGTCNLDVTNAAQAVVCIGE
jgi:outer membrane protein assembly factor BamB